MDNDIIRAYLWNDVIQLGFQITNYRKWIHTYFSSLQRFWEVYDYPCKFLPGGSDSIKAMIGNPELELWWEFDLRMNEDSDIEHFHIEFKHSKSNIWWHHSDFDFYGLPVEKMLDENKRSIAIANFLRDDLEIILDAMIFHCRAHQHIESPLKDHNIRIGGGIENPFLYLFHLRYQLCPKVKRDIEKRRVTDLFYNAIKNNLSIDDNLLLGT